MGGLIIGRIFSPEIWGGGGGAYFREGESYYPKFTVCHVYQKSHFCPEESRSSSLLHGKDVAHFAAFFHEKGLILVEKRVFAKKKKSFFTVVKIFPVLPLIFCFFFNNFVDHFLSPVRPVSLAVRPTIYSSVGLTEL